MQSLTWNFVQVYDQSAINITARHLTDCFSTKLERVPDHQWMSGDSISSKFFAKGFEYLCSSLFFIVQRWIQGVLGIWAPPQWPTI